MFSVELPVFIKQYIPPFWRSTGRAADAHTYEERRALMIERLFEAILTPILGVSMTSVLSKLRLYRQEIIEKSIFSPQVALVEAFIENTIGREVSYTELGGKPGEFFFLISRAQGTYTRDGEEVVFRETDEELDAVARRAEAILSNYVIAGNKGSIKKIL